MIVKVCSRHGDLTAEGIIKGGRCRECNKDYAQRWKLFNREKHRATANKHRDTNRAARDRANKKNRFYRQQDPEKYKLQQAASRAKQGKRRTSVEIACRVGISIEQYDELVEKHEGKCAICANPESRKALKVKGSPDYVWITAMQPIKFGVYCVIHAIQVLASLKKILRLCKTQLSTCRGTKD